jgi:tRNA threonylcarbamoyladenosine biosynthesis protein TsaB
VRVLAVDTTSPRGSLAIADETGILAEERVESTAGHSRWLLPAVQRALQELDLAAAAIDLFAVTSGPGSFTGLRVGISTVQGLSLAARKPCLGIPTLDVWARQARGTAPSITVVLDAFRGEVFWAVFGADADADLSGERHVGTLEEALAAAPAGSVFVGDVVEQKRETILAAVPAATFARASGFLAATLARMALERAAEAGPPAALAPVYLRGAAIRPPKA